MVVKIIRNGIGYKQQRNLITSFINGQARCSTFKIQSFWHVVIKI